MTRLGDALEVILGRRGAVRLEHQTEYALRYPDGSIHRPGPGPSSEGDRELVESAARYTSGSVLVAREVTTVREEWRTEL